MKTRTGFVSNSSSSSFIIGVGVVKDPFAFELTYPKWSESGNLPDGMEATTIAQLKAGERIEGDYTFEYNDEGNISKVLAVEVESFDYSSVDRDLSDCNDSDIVLVYHGGYSLDDSDMSIFDDDGDFVDYDYDVEYDMFNQEEQTAMDLLNGPLVDGTYRYGAGRNG